MSYNRNIKWLNDKHVIYRRDPVNECYHLFNSKAKITTYRSLKWHFYVLYFLNQQYLVFKPWQVYEFIANKEKLEEMIIDVLNNGGEPPINKKRKIIFKDYSGLTPNEKMSIVGKLIGRSSRVDGEAIYQCMIDLNDMGKTITWSKIAGLLKCSTRTIQRNLNDTLKKEKAILNQEL